MMQSTGHRQLELSHTVGGNMNHYNFFENSDFRVYCSQKTMHTLSPRDSASGYTPQELSSSCSCHVKHYN
jgi:hypothetical protein